MRKQILLLLVAVFTSSISETICLANSPSPKTNKTTIKESAPAPSSSAERFIVPSSTVEGKLFINCLNLKNDKVNALILDNGGNIVAWYSSKNMRVKNKQISLNLNFLDRGNYSIRLKSENAESVHSFFKK